MESTDDQASRDPRFANPAQIGINVGEDAPVRDVREKFPHTNTRELCSYGIGEAQRHAVLSLAIELSPNSSNGATCSSFSGKYPKSETKPSILYFRRDQSQHPQRKGSGRSDYGAYREWFGAPASDGLGRSFTALPESA